MLCSRLSFSPSLLCFGLSRLSKIFLACFIFIFFFPFWLSTGQLTVYDFRDRLQSMEKFQNGEVDVDNLCSELRTKARCSESGVVINKKDVDAIMGRAVQP